MRFPGLDELLSDTAYEVLIDAAPRAIRGIAYDSRAVREDFVFFAIPGLHTDGHRYIGAAVEAGAAVLAVSKDPAQEDLALARSRGVRVVKTGDTRTALAHAARRWYGCPEERLSIVGVTGTDGKSSTVWYTAQLLDFLGHRSGFVSTAEIRTAGPKIPNPLRQSTPEAPEIFSILREMADAGLTDAVIEATSHGLSEKTARLSAIGFQTGVFTNIDHEHLEFHGSFERYLYDKANLFRKLTAPVTVAAHAAQATPAAPKTSAGQAIPATPAAVASTDPAVSTSATQALSPAAVINACSAHARYLSLAAAPGSRILYYGVEDEIPEENRNLPLSLSARNIELLPDGVRFDAVIADSPCSLGEPDSADPALSGRTRTERVTAAIPGSFTVENLLASVLGAHAHTGRPIGEILAFVPRITGVKGRMRTVRAGQPFTVVVDYAHTPGSFRVVFPMFRKTTAGRLIAVFGSGGERDIEKRPIQGKIASEYCDLVILANEDPRLEDPAGLLSQIAAGIDPGACGVEIIPDRRSAIRRAFAVAREGDTVVLLGKGHEQSIIIGTEKHPWDEETAAYEVLAEAGFKSGSEPRTSIGVG